VKLQIGIDGKKYEVDVEVIAEDAAPRFPNYGPYVPLSSTVQSTPVAASRPAAPVAEADVDEDKVCRSPVAGVVIRVNVEPGQAIQADDLLMVLEAMKMETNVTAPATGKVKRIAVAAGDAVKVNQVVVELE
jgi:methylmalonyl-CoA carboxyltransferase small subunit